DLANPDMGAAIVGHLPEGSGAVGMSVRDALGLTTVDLLTRIPKSEWAAIAAKTSSFDCTPALAACVSTGKRVTISMPGRYKLATVYTGTTDFDLEGLGDDVELDMSSLTAGQSLTNSG